MAQTPTRSGLTGAGTRESVDVLAESQSILAALEGLRAAMEAGTPDTRGEPGVRELTAPETANPNLGQRIYPAMSRTLANLRRIY